MKKRIKNRLLSCLSALRKRILGKHGIAIICNTPTGIFAVSPEDMGVGGDLLRTGEYAVEEIRLLEKHLNPDSSVLIVGTHIGALLVPIAKRAGHVSGVEANPDTQRLLLMNIALNGLDNVELALIAASDKREQLTFLKSTTNSGGSKRMPKIHDQRYFYDAPESVTVEAHRLDDYFQRNFDHIIMDIEGSEVFALRGMERILSNSKTLQIEFLPHHLRNVAGVTVEEFLAPIQSHFQKLTIPSKGITIAAPQFHSALQAMFEADEGDDSLMFTSSKK